MRQNETIIWLIYIDNYNFVMSKNFKDQYKQEQQLEKDLAQFWGYSLPIYQIETKQKKQSEAEFPTVANITLRKFGKEIQKTERIKQIEDEIRALQNEKMLRDLKEGNYSKEALEGKSEIINLMQKMIGQYNNIVEHRHITDKKIAKARQDQKNLQTKHLNQSQDLIEEINRKRALLASADLKKQIILNKEIAKLYRQYKSKLDNNIPLVKITKSKNIPSNISKNQKTLKKYQSETFQHLQELSSLSNANKFFSLKLSYSDQKFKQMTNFIKKQSEQQNITEKQLMAKFKQLQYKKYMNSNRKNSTHFQNLTNPLTSRPSKSLDKQKTINSKNIISPFLEKQQIEQYKSMQNKIRSNSQALQNWKLKINDATNSSSFMRQFQESEKIKYMSKQKIQDQIHAREEQLSAILDKAVKIIDIDPNGNNSFAKEMKEKGKQHEIDKQHIFAELLRKRNNKFNKLWGTKILVKYDSHEQAKSLLRGQSDRNPNRKASSRNSSFSHTRQKSKESVHDTKKMEKTQDFNAFSARDIPKNGPSEELDWRKQQKDQQHYWRMCKNQKINLLLKRR